MKIILIIIQSLDGFIAKDQKDDLSWGSHEDKVFFRTLTKQLGTMIMGSNTYKKMPAFALGKRFSLVFTSQPEILRPAKAENIEFFKGTIKQALIYLEKKGIKNAALIGGGNINNQFLQAGLVDELYITIAPRIFAKGINSFGENKLDIKLKLLDTKSLTQDEILLHYQVLKQ